jgi:hypothetical protein
MYFCHIFLLATSQLALAASCQKADESPRCGKPVTVHNLTYLSGYVL